jgi:serine/threonine protein phosphatase PrpC
VPRYLYGWQLTHAGQKYRYLDYSSTIRIVTTAPPWVLADGIEHRGSVTTVLPDHFYSGHYDYIEDRFPCETHFVLCSDGFYSAFATTSQMWAWLQENRDAPASVQEQEPKLRDLHQQLHEKGGDDDMSFVWIYPTPATAPVGAGAAAEQEE